MHRYEELEKIYYRKKIIKIFLLILSLIVLFIIGFYTFGLNKTKKKDKKEFNLSKIAKSSKIKKDVKILKIKANKKVNFDSNIYKLKFILPTIDNSITQKEVKNVVRKKITSKIKSNIKKENNKENPYKDSIKIIEKKADIKTLIRQYNLSPNYELAIEIAKYFYKKNNLKAAQNWVLNANNLDATRPDSWLLFADILLKEGKKDKAKKVLSVYIDDYGNNDKIIKKLRSLNE